MAAVTGSAWRGALGHPLRASACRTGAPTCKGCPHLHECDYSLIFETPTPPSHTAPGPETAPHPFALTTAANPMGEQEVTLALFGAGTRFLPPLLGALEAAASVGIGPDRVRHRLEAVECEQPLGSRLWRPLRDTSTPTPVDTPAAPAACHLRLLTPLRLRLQGHYLTPKRFHFADLMASLTQRIEALCALYADPINADFRALAAAAAAIAIEQADLRWHDQSRYSSRQQKAVPTGGLLGSFTVNLSSAPDLWPYLWLGQFTQAGKGTSLGLGQYTVQEIPCAN